MTRVERLAQSNSPQTLGICVSSAVLHAHKELPATALGCPCLAEQASGSVFLFPAFLSVEQALIILTPTPNSRSLRKPQPAPSALRSEQTQQKQTLPITSPSGNSQEV